MSFYDPTEFSKKSVGYHHLSDEEVIRSYCILSCHEFFWSGHIKTLSFAGHQSFVWFALFIFDRARFLFPLLVVPSKIQLGEGLFCCVAYEVKKNET